MGFQDTKLPSSLITEMYKRVLIEEPADASRTVNSDPLTNDGSPAEVRSAGEQKNTPARTEAVPARKEPLSFIGGNGKNISLIASGKKVLTESAPETQFLLKILSACSLSMKDIALYDNAQSKLNVGDFLEGQQPHKLLMFSTGSELLFQVQKIEQTEILYAPAVQELMKVSAEAVQLKKKLWAALKNFFNV